MSVKKVDFHSVFQSKKSFTTNFNEVIQNIHDGFILGVYVYLSSLPPDWNVNINQLMSHFSVGRDKIKRTLSWLNKNQLIKYTRARNEDGTFYKPPVDNSVQPCASTCAIEVQEGLTFIEKHKSNHIPKSNSSTRLKTQRVDNPAHGKSAPTNKIINKNTNNNKNTNKSYCASDDARPRSANLLFDHFWEIYPKKKNKERARSIWEMNRYDDLASLIFDDVRNRTLNEIQWREDQFIPHPSTYLQNKRWEDEITLGKIPAPKKESPMEMAFRMCLS